ncbi:MAG: CHASE domain-containing protein [Cyanobium sp.]
MDAIRSKLETNISILSGIAGFFNGATTVSRDAFRTFHESVALNTGQLKGVQGVGFARSIPAAELTAYEAAIRGQRTNLLRSGRHDAAFYGRLWQQLTSKGYWEGDLWNRIQSGELRCHHLSISAVRDEALQTTCFVDTYHDVTERHDPRVRSARSPRRR